MVSSSEAKKAGEAYAAAYTLHYVEDNLLDALLGYRELIICYPHTAQASHSRSQIGNIAKRVVPADKLIDAQVALARPLLERALLR